MRHCVIGGRAATVFLVFSAMIPACGSPQTVGAASGGGSTGSSTVSGTTTTPPGGSDPNAVETSPTGTGAGTTPGTCAQLWAPNPNSTWLWDLDNATVPVPTVSSSHVQDYNAAVYDVDMFMSTAAQITAYHQAGKKVICYVDVGSFESGRPDGKDFDPNCYCGPGYAATDGCAAGSPHKMDGWPEWWLDVRNDSCATNIHTVLAARFKMAAQKGCDAVEPDNVDSYENNAGWGTTITDQTAFNVWLAQTAHANCLGVLLKNAGDMLQDGTAGPQLVKAFDFSLNEQCHQYTECDSYAGFIQAGKAAFNAEYPGSTAKANYCGTAGMKTLQYDSLSVEYGNLLQVCN